jgi:hypothetical protein
LGIHPVGGLTQTLDCYKVDSDVSEEHTAAIFRAEDEDYVTTQNKNIDTFITMRTSNFVFYYHVLHILPKSFTVIVLLEDTYPTHLIKH